jgi:hypothetical protein
MNDIPTYRRTQKGPLGLLLYVVGAAFVVFGWLAPHPPERIALLVAGIAMFPLGMSFHYLTVAGEANCLALRFGPIPLFHKRIAYGDIRGVERGRTNLLDGWGIHLSVRGGWVWNIWGRNCVVIRRRQGTIRVGTDDPVGLSEYLKARVHAATG